MQFVIRRIATRFAFILAIAAVLPLLAYGFVSLISLQRGTRESVVAGNQNVAVRAAEEIGRYLSSHADILKALGADLQDTQLNARQQDRIVKNFVLTFREFREITLFDEAGETVATSRVGPPRVAIPQGATITINGALMSPIRVDEDQLPTAVFAIHLKQLNRPSGWLVGQFSLEEMWRMVDDIRIGNRGFALVVAPDGTLIAHGDPDQKSAVAQSQVLTNHPLIGRGEQEPPWIAFTPANAPERLAVAARIESLGWTVLVEQPTSEAYANSLVLQRQLTVAIAAALIVMIMVGWFFGRQFIAPIFTLKRATQAVASGQMDARVEIATGDEFQDLGASFNAMADRLVELQEDVKRKERQAMFGRIAAGLVHDLSHPIQNIGNSTRLLLRDDLDDESRDLFHRTIDRELATLKRFMDDLRNIVKPKPIERFAMDVNSTAAEIVDAMRAEGERTGVVVEASYDDGPLTIDADRFALGRVLRNLITNAIQATAPGGRVTITSKRAADHIEIIVSDTGSGIPADRLPAIFDEYMTTKRRGLGLGLAICKRIVEQLEGTITVTSEVGRGTEFTMRFPAQNAPSARAAS
jgi:signal transduction histidine kinase